MKQSTATQATFTFSVRQKYGVNFYDQSGVAESIQSLSDLILNNSKFGADIKVAYEKYFNGGKSKQRCFEFKSKELNTVLFNVTFTEDTLKFRNPSEAFRNKNTGWFGFKYNTPKKVADFISKFDEAWELAHAKAKSALEYTTKKTATQNLFEGFVAPELKMLTSWYEAEPQVLYKRVNVQPNDVTIQYSAYRDMSGSMVSITLRPNMEPTVYLSNLTPTGSGPIDKVMAFIPTMDAFVKQVNQMVSELDADAQARFQSK